MTSLNACELEVESVIPNMATTLSDPFLARLMPETYRRGENVETFIKECKTFFKYASYSAARQEIVIPCLLERELREEYETVDAGTQKWEDKLIKAFQQKTSFMDDLQEALSYKQTTEEPRVFFDKVEKLATKILSHSITKEFLVEQLLLKCSKEKTLK